MVWFRGALALILIIVLLAFRWGRPHGAAYIPLTLSQREGRQHRLHHVRDSV